MANVVTRADVLSAYRYLLRSVRITFQGDKAMLTAAKKEARNRFDEGKELDPESPGVAAGVQEAREIGQLLRRNIVQGVREGDSNNYRLRIHGETERGDNSTIKNPPPRAIPERQMRRKKTDLS